MTEGEKGTAIAERTEYNLLLDVLAGKVEPPPVDPVALNDRITRAMLEADTPEAALAAGATVSFEDGLMGVPIEVRDVWFRPSSLKGDVPVFALIDGYRLDEGVEVTITCSALQVMRALGVYKVRGWLPAAFRVTKQENPTAAGFTPYQIEAV